MSFDFAHDRDGVTLRVRFERTGILSRLLGREAPRDLDRLGPDDRALSLAIADLRAIADDHPGELTIAGDTIRMSHTIAAELGGDAAAVLGMPPLVDLTLRTDVEGVPGSAGFRLRCDWVRAGQPQAVRREGAFLQTSSGVRRLPAWVMAALDVADSPPAARDDAAHWAALARFRHALDPGVEVVSSPQARVAMSEFLAGLEVRLADRLSIAPNAAGDDFEVIPFSGDRLEALAEGEAVGQEHAELGGESLRSFQAKVRQRGALNAYRLGRGSYVVVGRAAQPALRLMAEVQRAPVGERLAFIANPRPRLSAAVEAALRAEGGLEGLDPAAEEEAIAAAAEPLFVETREFSERVRGVRVYEPPDIDLARASGTTWLPEIFSEQVGRVLAGLPTDELQALTDRVEAAIADGQESVALAGERLPASRETLTALKARLAARTGTADEDGDTTEEATAERLIVETKDNFDALGWRPETPERVAAIPTDPPHGIRTTLKPHQIAGLAWQIDAWRAGLPGVLNADEQGLGKTLQTLAFLRWLDVHQAAAGNGKPILVVAPTSLLRNWEQEAERHLEAPGLGHLLRLYGSGLGSVRRTDRGRFEMRTGLESLDFGRLPDIAAGRGWILTTYTTLVNYQHSLARLPLAAIVFDEIQSVKNPVSLRACAARALNADFRIGLTGTPIENSVVDLWAIMDQLAPGTLGTLQEFRGRYEEAAPEALADLHRRLFHPCGTQPALALRRLKDDVAGDLPEKSRRLHPRLMPTGQAQVYEEARLKLASGGPGAALKMLHHIRSVSVHPWIGSGADHAGFIEESARLSATFDILRRIAANRERALVFIEHRQMQHRFVELARATFGLSRIDIINGDTPIARRQQIVDTFQRHMQQDGGFDLLVLGPKAAGVGLTLTAATHVIHLSRWWNPAVEEQCNDRVHRIGQTRAVTIHVPMAVHPGYQQDSSDCLLHDLMQRKRRLARSALWPMGDTSADVHRLQESLSAGVEQAPGDPLANAIERMFERQCISRPPNGPDGSLPFA